MTEGQKQRQQASAAVESRMMDFLLNFTPAQDLTVATVQQIARSARTIAFDEFTASAEKGLG